MLEKLEIKPDISKYIHKIWLIMRLITVVLIATIMQVSATGFAQKISLNKSNTSLEKIIKNLRAQSGYNFVVPGELFEIAKPVTIKVKDVEFKVILNEIFENQPITYEINNNTVTLKEKPKSFLETVLAQFSAITVTGKVVDSLTGNPLAGANVMVKGQKQFASVGADGGFILQNVNQDAILVITYVGYATREIKSARDVGTIKMSVEVAKLQEVGITVNTGYQRIKPEQSTGAISQISATEYEARISTNFLDGLVNRLPGLMINNNVNFTSTTPGSTNSNSRPLFNIRGISTMSANQSPLIVIDGYPTELTIDMIDPNEIKSVTILKDAAAATIYGVRASNGVIIIERKQAVAGKAKLTFRTTVGITPKENYNRYRWADDASPTVTNYQRTTQSAIVNNTSWGLLFTSGAGTIARSAPYYIAAQAAAKMITPEQAEKAYADLAGYDNLNDYSKLFLRNAVTRTHNLNVSGGNENALYYITANYTGNEQSQVQNDNNRFSLSARTTIKLNKKLSLELTNDYQEQRVNSAPVPDVTSIAPYEHFQDVNGNPTPIISSNISGPYNDFVMSQGLEDFRYYPLIDLNEISDKTHTVNNRITANFKYNLAKGFELSFGGIYETSDSEARHLATDRSSEVKKYIDIYAFRNTDGTLKFNIPKGSFLRQQNSKTSSYTARAQLNYNKSFGPHSINAIIGSEVRSLVTKGNTTSSFGYNDQTLLQQAVDYASITANAVATRGTYGFTQILSGTLDNLFNQQYNEDRFISGYSNVVYSYKNTYSATGSIRIDQSNLFGTNPKYKYKPLWSVGAAWNIKNEKFMEDIAWVKQLKLRVAYGFNGNVAKLSLPEVIASPVFNTSTSPTSPALRLASYANSSLRWEQTKNFNIGLDFSIFKNITGSIDYYKKKSTDLLGNVLIDPTLGVSPTLINQATIDNNGIELGLHADWITTENFNWNTGIVVARNTSEVLEVYRRGDFNPQTLNALGYVKGYPVGAMFAYNYAGLDAEGYPLVQNSAGTQYRTNVNSTGNPLNALMATESGDLSHYVGSSIPTINSGLSNRIDIGSFYFFSMINYYGGFKVRVPRANPASLRPLDGAGNYWKVAGDELNTDVMGLAGYAGANSNNVYNYADKYVVNGDYITLADLTVSYNLAKVDFIKNAGFRNFEIKAQASNVVTVGFNRYNFSMGTGSFQKSYLTPTYTIGLFTNF